MSSSSRSRIVAEVDFDRNGRQHGFLRLFHSVHSSAYGFIPIPIVVLRNGTVAGVETEHGTIRCETVVDAAGGWLRAVAALAGAQVKMVPTRHQLLITEPIDGVQPMQPITRIIDANVYVRPDEGGLMLGGYEADPMQFPNGKLPERFDIADLKLDLGVLRRLADSVREQLPVFQRVPGEIKLRVHRGGLPTMTVMSARF